MWTDEQVRELLTSAYLDAYKLGQNGGVIIDLLGTIESYLETDNLTDH